MGHIEKLVERYKSEPALWTGLLTGIVILSTEYMENGTISVPKVLRAAVPAIGGAIIRLHVSPRFRDRDRRGTPAAS